MGRKAKVIAAVIPVIILAITVWWYYEYQDITFKLFISAASIEHSCYAPLSYSLAYSADIPDPSRWEFTPSYTWELFDIPFQ